VTNVRVGAPDRIDAQGVDSAVASIDAMILKAEHESHLLAVGLEMNEVANLAKGGSDVLDDALDVDDIGLGEIEDGLLGVGVNHDSQLHLAFEVVDKRRLLALDEGVLVASDVLDLEAMLLKDLLAFCSVTKVIEAKVDATSVDRDTGVEASILDHSQQGQARGRNEDLPASSGAGPRRARARHQDRRWCHQEAGGRSCGER